MSRTVGKPLARTEDLWFLKSLHPSQSKWEVFRAWGSQMELNWPSLYIHVHVIDDDASLFQNRDPSSHRKSSPSTSLLPMPPHTPWVIHKTDLLAYVATHLSRFKLDLAFLGLLLKAALLTASSTRSWSFPRALSCHQHMAMCAYGLFGCLIAQDDHELLKNRSPYSAHYQCLPGRYNLTHVGMPWLKSNELEV